METISSIKTWHPNDFGFFEEVDSITNTEPDKPKTYRHGDYQLKALANDMWLLRRGENKLIKFYYQIKHTDYEFANWLLNKRLNKY